MIDKLSIVQKVFLIGGLNALLMLVLAILLIQNVQPVLVTSLFILLSIMLTWWLSRLVIAPISELAEHLHQATRTHSGVPANLKVSAESELGKLVDAVNRVIGNLQSLILKSDNLTQELAASCTVGLEAMKLNLQGAESQRTETRKAAERMTDLQEAFQEIASNTAKAASMTNDAREQIQVGKNGADETRQVVDKLVNQVTHSASIIESLGQESNNIGEVVVSIQGIAEQTNLLALNAAIEAARAGESGRGFAVVADEVRTLASRVQSSTVDIQKLVESLQKEAQRAVATMEQGKDSAKHCLECSSNTAKTLEKASVSGEKIYELNSSIAQSTKQQTNVVDELTSGVNKIQSVASSNASRAQETRQAMDTIMKQLISLKQSLADLRQ